jgi:Alkylmercury lyase
LSPLSRRGDGPVEELDRKIRKMIFDYLLENATAPSLEEIAGHFAVPLADAHAALKRLDDAHQIKLLEGTNRILMAFPFSAISTPYRVTRPNGRRYFANCAWDAVAFHVMLDEPVQIDSFCAACGEPVQFRLDGGHGARVHNPLPLIQLRLPAAAWWKDITRTCANTMVFLCSPKHVPGDAGKMMDQGVVTVEQILQMSGPIYRDKMRLEYERPPSSAIQATYDRVGLTGPHWKL